MVQYVTFKLNVEGKYIVLSVYYDRNHNTFSVTVGNEKWSFTEKIIFFYIWIVSEIIAFLQK